MKDKRHKDRLPSGEQIDAGWQITTGGNLPAKDRPGPGDPQRFDRKGNVVGMDALEAAYQLSPEELQRMEERVDLFLKDENALLKFVKRESLMAIQIAGAMMKASFVGPSANAQRLSAINTIIKEGQEIVASIMRIKGLE